MQITFLLPPVSRNNLARSRLLDHLRHARDVRHDRMLYCRGRSSMLHAMTSAQYEFRRLLRDFVSPAMRSAGLKGSAGHYQLPNQSCFALIAFQKSKYSTAITVEFTINLKAVSRQIWDRARADMTWLPKIPTANSRYPVAEWSMRIGNLMPGTQDHWWSLRSGQPLDQLAVEVIGTLNDYGLPALRSAVAQAA